MKTGPEERFAWHRALHCLSWLGAGVVVVRFCIIAPLAGDPANANKDFSHLWLGGRMIVTGQFGDLYDPHRQEQTYREADPSGEPPAGWLNRSKIVGAFFYPPPTAVAYSLLAWLPRSRAAVVNAYLNIFLALVVAALLARGLHERIPPAVSILAVLLYPVSFVTLALGQNSFCTTAVMLLAWIAADRRRDLLAGLVLGLLVLKPNWLVALGWIPLVQSRWRMLSGMLCSAAVLMGLTVLFTGIAPFVEYRQLLTRLASLAELPGYNLALTYNGSSVFRKWFGIGILADWLGWCSSAVVLLVTWFVTRARRRAGSMDSCIVMGCCLGAALWVNPHLFYYDLMPMLACLAVMGLEWRRCGQAGRLMTAVIAMVSYLAVTWDEHWSWGAIFPVPSLAILAVWLWFCLRIVQDRPAAMSAAPVSGRLSNVF